MCSESVYGPIRLIAFTATRKEIKAPCQKEKKIMPWKNTCEFVKTLPTISSDLDAKKLWHWPEGQEVVVDTHPEHGQAVKTQEDGKVEDDGNVEISAICAKISFVVDSRSLEYYGNHC